MQDINNRINYSEHYFKLENDLGLTQYSWGSIGFLEAPCSGTFDGNGKNIVGLNINSPDNYQGLLGCIQYATIKNVHLLDSYVSGGKQTGGIVGIASYNQV